MKNSRLIPTTLVVAALIGSACAATTADSSGTINTPESTVEIASPTAPSSAQPAPTAPAVTAGVAPEPTSTPAAAQPSTPAPPPTITPTPSPPTTVPSVDTAPIDAVDVANQSVFGIRIFDALDVEAAAGEVSARLGSPTLDNGWQSMAGQVDCTGSTEFRVLWWGDFRMTFERYQGDGAVRDELSAWTVGEPTLFGLVPIGVVPPTSPSDIVTLEGIGVGSTRADVEAAWSNINGAGDGRVIVVDSGGTLAVTFDGGDQVLGFGHGPFDCPTDELR